MRLWSIHPALLDDEGLRLVWRDALAAQAALLGQGDETVDPNQLRRFQDCESPQSAIVLYLRSICEEGQKRSLDFNVKQIRPRHTDLELHVTRGQVEYEIDHLAAQLADRDIDRMHDMLGMTGFRLHPLFRLVEGDVEIPD